MKEIKTMDYVSEYEFRRSTGPKYQTSSLRPVVHERKKGEERYPEGLMLNRPKRKERMRKNTGQTEIESMAFDEDTYKGVQGARGYGIAQWSTTDRKKALYEFAESWAAEKGETFDIGGIDMQVAHLQETINTSYASMKESLIKEKDMVKACYLWIAT